MSPTTSPFFSNVTGHSGETSLVDSLVIEQIKLYGLDVMYLPRRMVNYDKLLNESTKSVFEVALSIPMYIKSYSGYNNGMELLTKFGVRASDELTMVMSKTQFQTYYAPFIKSYYQSLNKEEPQSELDPLKGQTEYRPKEGDLIYFPFDDGLFEIKYVNVDSEFFQMGKNYIFEMLLEKFEYSGEYFDTSIENIDIQQVDTQYYKMQFELDPNGIDTFLFNEEVKIYKLDDAPSIGVQDFRLYEEAGFLVDVPYVKGNVMKWNKPQGILVVGQISNEDPTQRNSLNLDTNEDKLKNVLIIGQQSDAIYRSLNAKVEVTSFNEDENIQEEFDVIKILDIADETPFGFL